MFYIMHGPRSSACLCLSLLFHLILFTTLLIVVPATLTYFMFLFLLFSLFGVWLHHKACGIGVPHKVSNLYLCSGSLSLKVWTTREVPPLTSFNFQGPPFSCIMVLLYLCSLDVEYSHPFLEISVSHSSGVFKFDEEDD